MHVTIYGNTESIYLGETEDVKGLYPELYYPNEDLYWAVISNAYWSIKVVQMNYKHTIAMLLAVTWDQMIY